MAGLKKTKEKKPRAMKPQPHDSQWFDERFAAALNRPQFARVKEETNKVVLDDRFALVLTDPRFQLQENDKYGIKKKRQGPIEQTNELTAFYTVANEELKEGEHTEHGESSTEESMNEENQDEIFGDGHDDPASRIAYLTALSRGELDVSSSSEDDASLVMESDQDSDMEGDGVDEIAGVLDPSNKEEDEISITEVESPYMAVMNMDWSHVRAVDLFAILSSFTPPGSVKKVQIFPSDFGKVQMAKEETQGPIDIWKGNNFQNDDNAVEPSEDEESSFEGEGPSINMKIQAGTLDTDFDPEKLRSYEASKLKYYFAVVEFNSPELANLAYKEVDGLELEHSSAAMDLRSIGPNQLKGVTEGRKLRDEATALPSKYDPPEFVVGALQQTNVNCTWDDGDMERERKLTRYSQQADWSAMAEGEDLKAYLASDNSSIQSDDESSEGEEDDGKGAKKGSEMRKMLGLESDDDDGFSSGEEDDVDKMVTFTPGKGKGLEEKIRSKLDSKAVEEITPWEKYQEKRKQKRREKRQTLRSKRGGNAPSANEAEIYDDDPDFGQTKFVGNSESGDSGDFLVDRNTPTNSKQQNSTYRMGKVEVEDERTAKGAPSTKAELELILAGDNDEEATKDYNMRGIIRMDKNKGKKLKGARKRKEAALASNTSGGDFSIDVMDTRFAAVLQGSDDRFGIDRTDSSYKDTEAMRKILSEQTKQRRATRKKPKLSHVVGDANAESISTNSSSGAAALSSLVRSLKSKVAKKSQ
jgi:hypothetical protein